MCVCICPRLVKDHIKATNLQNRICFCKTVPPIALYVYSMDISAQGPWVLCVRRYLHVLSNPCLVVSITKDIHCNRRSSSSDSYWEVGRYPYVVIYLKHIQSYCFSVVAERSLQYLSRGIWPLILSASVRQQICNYGFVARRWTSSPWRWKRWGSIRHRNGWPMEHSSTHGPFRCA